jgi:hypothetical protein
MAGKVARHSSRSWRRSEQLDALPVAHSVAESVREHCRARGLLISRFVGEAVSFALSAERNAPGGISGDSRGIGCDMLEPANTGVTDAGR